MRLVEQPCRFETVAPDCSRSIGAPEGAKVLISERLGIDRASGFVVLRELRIGPAAFVLQREEIAQLRRDPPSQAGFYRSGAR